METRQKVIEHILLVLDIPAIDLSLVHYPQPGGVGPCDPDYFKNYFKERRAAEERIQAQLADMSDYELLELRDTPGALDALAFDCRLLGAPEWYAGGFNVRGRRARFDHWLALDFWTIEEATCLSIGFEPQAMPIDNNIPRPGKVLPFYWRRRELIRRAELHRGGDPDKIAPKDFAKWAAGRNGIDFCEEVLPRVISESTPEFPASVDARLLDSLQKLFRGLLMVAYNGNISEPEVKKDILSKLAELGITISEPTVRKRIREVLARFPDPPGDDS